MKVLINISDEVNAELAKISEARNGVPREKLVLEAISKFIEESKAHDVFGMLAGQNGDGLEYQVRMRAEWNNR
ncbi:hypothetical protein ACO0LC_22625 [Undibacterium sp. JH2W]|uniref:hypothetical protein n=1 Tax=Undibacterium TaxID=401469 RepID=UPI003BF176BE